MYFRSMNFLIASIEDSYETGIIGVVSIGPLKKWHAVKVSFE